MIATYVLAYLFDRDGDPFHTTALAALLILAPANHERPGPRGFQPIAAAIGALSLALLFLSATSVGRLGAVVSAYIVLVTAAFGSLALLQPGTVLRQSLRAILLGGIATVLLIQLLWGSDGWGAISWEITRQTSSMMRWLARPCMSTTKPTPHESCSNAGSYKP